MQLTIIAFLVASTSNVALGMILDCSARFLRPVIMNCRLHRRLQCKMNFHRNWITGNEESDGSSPRTVGTSLQVESLESPGWKCASNNTLASSDFWSHHRQHLFTNDIWESANICHISAILQSARVLAYADTDCRLAAEKNTISEVLVTSWI